MKNDEDKDESKINQKCSPCFKRDWCMLLPSQRSECLGPFKDEKDNMKKFMAFSEAEEKKAKIVMNKDVREAMIDIYRWNRKQFDSLVTEDNDESSDDQK